jgi:hypothetical protein
MAAECVIQFVSGNHEATACKSDQNLDRVGWQSISPPGASEDEGQTDKHEQ